MVIEKKLESAKGFRDSSTLAWENDTIPAKIDAGGINYKRVTRVTDSFRPRDGDYVWRNFDLLFEVSRCINSTRLFIYSSACDPYVSADVEATGNVLWFASSPFHGM